MSRTRYISIDLGVKNLSICVMTIPSKSIEAKDILRDVMVEHWLVTSIGYHKETMDHLVPSICDTIKPYSSDCKVDRVLIERQPGTNKQTVNLSHALRGYFHDKIPSQLISGSIKHKFCDQIGYVRKGKGYEVNKETAVLAATYVVNFLFKKYPQKFAKFKSQFDEAKKKDDLADSLLQGLAYHMVKPKIPKRRDGPPTKRKKKTTAIKKKTRKKNATTGIPTFGVIRKRLRPSCVGGCDPSKKKRTRKLVDG